ncbi:MAG: bile acid:sodium symporter [Gemmataceae bacterium]
MAGRNGVLGRANGWLHRHFLWLLVGAYLLAAVWPWAGSAIRHTTVLDTGMAGTISLPMVLLAFLLFHAGLAADATDLAGVVRRPVALLAGVAATVAVPLAVVAGLAAVLGWRHDPDEARCLIAGLGIVAAMPVAGSSAAWSQHAGGSAALSLGLVVASTVLSPLTTPLALAAVGPLNADGNTPGLLGPGTVTFLVVSVVIPSVAGMVLRRLIGPKVVSCVQPGLKAAGTLVLLVLCYANATASLPSVAAAPDWDYLALVVAAVGVLCGSGFAAGWAVARLVGAGDSQRRSLVFGLGMTNNGTGLVMAGAALSGVPAAILPVLAYNLVQHLFAGAVSRRLASECCEHASATTGTPASTLGAEYTPLTRA